MGLLRRLVASGDRDGGLRQAAIVRYRPTESRGTAVDTVMATNLAPRTDADPVDEFAQPEPDGLRRRIPLG